MGISRVACFLMVGVLLGSPAWAVPPEPFGTCAPQVEVEPNGTPAAASPIALLNPNSDLFVGIAGAIDVPGDEDWYSFAAPAGARLWLAVDTGVATSSLSTRRSSRALCFPRPGPTSPACGPRAPP